MIGTVVFLGIDPSRHDLDDDAQRWIAAAKELFVDAAVRPQFEGRDGLSHVTTSLPTPRLLDALSGGQVVVRAFVATPTFDDAALQEIQAVAEAPVRVVVLPAAGVAQLPLAGRRVLITRAREQASETERSLLRRGARPVHLPTIEIGPPDDRAGLDRAARSLATYDVVAFTSANGVDALFSALDAAALDARAFGGARIAAIGPGTTRALTRRGLRVDIEAEEHRGEGLARVILDAMESRASGERRVLLPRAAVARSALPDALSAAGVHVDVVEAYRTRRPSEEATRTARDRLRGAPPDAITFTSSSTAENFVALFPDAAELLRDVVVASIGPITTDTCKKLGLRVDVEANPYTLPALVEALEAYFSRINAR